FSGAGTDSKCQSLCAASTPPWQTPRLSGARCGHPYRRCPQRGQWPLMELSVEISRLLGRSEAAPTRGVVLRPILSDIRKRIGHWRRTRRAEQELFALDDRMLKDIGLCRSEIAGAVRGTPRIDKLSGDQQL